jgi:prolyl-tRNA editing enzyme YbaK/EbsC (Cys-tRNA(Pro) deacylase)
VNTGSFATGASGRLVQALATGIIDAELIRPGVPTPTVPDAAAALGVTNQQILKSLLFTAPDGYVVLAIACGSTRVDPARLADVVGAASLRLASPAMVFDRTGYPAGGIPPVGHATIIDVVIDRAVMDIDVAFAGGGDVDLLLRITPQEIVRVTGARVADIAP